MSNVVHGQTLATVIRAATLADANRLAVLATQVWLHTYATDGISDDIAEYTLTHLTPQRQLAAIGEPNTRVWVAERGDNIVGLAVVKMGDPCPDADSSVELQTLYVQEHFVHQDIGRLLLHAAQSHAQACANTPLWLTVNAQNANAIGFYQRMGYSKVGTAYFTVGRGRHENHVLIGPIGQASTLDC